MWLEGSYPLLQRLLWIFLVPEAPLNLLLTKIFSHGPDCWHLRVIQMTAKAPGKRRCNPKHIQMLKGNGVRWIRWVRDNSHMWVTVQLTWRMRGLFRVIELASRHLGWNLKAVKEWNVALFLRPPI
jgi:hypothetical protein